MKSILWYLTNDAGHTKLRLIPAGNIHAYFFERSEYSNRGNLMSIRMSSAACAADRRVQENLAMPETRLQAGVVPGVGSGIGSGHYGELFQGEIRDSLGVLRRCLVTLPCRMLQSRAEFTVLSGEVKVWPASKIKAKRAAELTLEHLKVEGTGGSLVLESNIPEGKGNGSSSADCVAAARAVASAMGRTIPPAQLAQLVVAAESASDSIMFDYPTLFAHREGVVLEAYGYPLPPVEVIGIDAEPGRRIETLAYQPAAYTVYEQEAFKLLTDVLRQAICSQDPRLLGEIANLSALINQRFLPNALFNPLFMFAREIGALGVSVAHSGTVICVLLDPADPTLDHKIERLQGKLAADGIEHVHRFRVA